jgi:hypothetical protein
VEGRAEEGLAFFCRRITLVHFFSNNVSYFLTVTALKVSSSSPSSVLSAATAFGKLFADKYATIDL